MAQTEYQFDEHEWELYCKLTELQQRFVIPLLQGVSRVQAYRQAKGPEYQAQSNDRACACGILTNLNVKAFLGYAKKKQFQAKAMDREEAIAILSDISRTSLSELVNFSSCDVTDAQGDIKKQSLWSFKDSDQLTQEQLGSIAELNASRDGLKIKMHSRTEAIKQLAAMGGWNAPKSAAVVVTEPSTAQQATDMTDSILGRLNPEERDVLRKMVDDTPDEA